MTARDFYFTLLPLYSIESIIPTRYPVRKAVVGNRPAEYHESHCHSTRTEEEEKSR